MTSCSETLGGVHRETYLRCVYISLKYLFFIKTWYKNNKPFWMCICGSKVTVRVFNLSKPPVQWDRKLQRHQSLNNRKTKPCPGKTHSKIAWVGPHWTTLQGPWHHDETLHKAQGGKAILSRSKWNWTCSIYGEIWVDDILTRQLIWWDTTQCTEVIYSMKQRRRDKSEGLSYKHKILSNKQNFYTENPISCPWHYS